MLLAACLIGVLPAEATCVRSSGFTYSQDLIYSEPLSSMDTTCWTYSGNASFINSGSCYPAAKFTGGGDGTVYQDTVANGPGDYYSAMFYIDIYDTHHSWQDELDIYVLDASNNQLLASMGSYSGASSPVSCSSQSVNFGYQPSWHGKTLRVEIYAYEGYSDARFIVSGVHLWASTS